MALERHGSLVSSGAPARANFLNGVWRRNAQEPTVADRPHFTKCHLDSAGQPLVLHVYYSDKEGMWYIAGAVQAPLVFALARTDAQHPGTVSRSTWHLAGGIVSEASKEFHLWSEFEFKCVGPNTEAEPYLLEELGIDFFYRVKLTRTVVWFECPSSGKVYHSAAKGGGPGGRLKTGKRYCHLCDKCFSANNFQTQHLELHRPLPPPPPVAALDKLNNVHLLWKPPTTCDTRPAPSAYKLRFSEDGGLTWQVLEDTLVDATRTSISNLSSSHVYCFSVAAINIAGRGEFSDPCKPLRLSTTSDRASPTSTVATVSSIASPRSELLSSDGNESGSQHSSGVDTSEMPLTFSEGTAQGAPQLHREPPSEGHEGCELELLSNSPPLDKATGLLLPHSHLLPLPVNSAAKWPPLARANSPPSSVSVERSEAPFNEAPPSEGGFIDKVPISEGKIGNPEVRKPKATHSSAAPSGAVPESLTESLAERLQADLLQAERLQADLLQAEKLKLPTLLKPVTGKKRLHEEDKAEGRATKAPASAPLADEAEDGLSMLCEERGARGSSIQLLNEEMKQSDASIDMRSLLACPAQSQDAVGGAQCGGVPSGAASFTEEEMVINLEQLLAFAFESPNKKPWGSRFGGSLGNQQPPMGNAPCGNGAPAPGCGSVCGNAMGEMPNLTLPEPRGGPNMPWLFAASFAPGGEGGPRGFECGAEDAPLRCGKGGAPVNPALMHPSQLAALLPQSADCNRAYPSLSRAAFKELLLRQQRQQQQRQLHEQQEAFGAFRPNGPPSNNGPLVLPGQYRQASARAMASGADFDGASSIAAMRARAEGTAEAAKEYRTNEFGKMLQEFAGNGGSNGGLKEYSKHEFGKMLQDCASNGGSNGGSHGGLNGGSDGGLNGGLNGGSLEASGSAGVPHSMLQELTASIGANLVAGDCERQLSGGGMSGSGGLSCRSENSSARWNEYEALDNLLPDVALDLHASGAGSGAATPHHLQDSFEAALHARESHFRQTTAPPLYRRMEAAEAAAASADGASPSRTPRLSRLRELLEIAPPDVKVRLISAEWLHKLCSASHGEEQDGSEAGNEYATSLGASTQSCSSSESSGSSNCSPLLLHSPRAADSDLAAASEPSLTGSISSCASHSSWGSSLGSSWGSLPAPEPLAAAAPSLPALSLLLSHRLAAQPALEPEHILAELPSDAATARLLSEARLLRAAAPPPPSSTTLACQAEASAAAVLSLPKSREPKGSQKGRVPLIRRLFGRLLQLFFVAVLLSLIALPSLAMRVSAPLAGVSPLHSASHVMRVTHECGPCFERWRGCVARPAKAEERGGAARLIRLLLPRRKQQRPPSCET